MTVELAATKPDPHARARMAAILYEITRWDVFADADDEVDERAYVSRLWAEDWDSTEDAIYDEQ